MCFSIGHTKVSCGMVSSAQTQSASSEQPDLLRMSIENLGFYRLRTYNEAFLRYRQAPEPGTCRPRCEWQGSGKSELSVWVVALQRDCVVCGPGALQLHSPLPADKSPGGKCFVKLPGDSATPTAG